MFNARKDIIGFFEKGIFPFKGNVFKKKKINQKKNQKKKSKSQLMMVLFLLKKNQGA